MLDGNAEGFLATRRRASEILTSTRERKHRSTAVLGRSHLSSHLYAKFVQLLWGDLDKEFLLIWRAKGIRTPTCCRRKMLATPVSANIWRDSRGFARAEGARRMLKAHDIRLHAVCPLDDSIQMNTFRAFLITIFFPLKLESGLKLSCRRKHLAIME